MKGISMINKFKRLFKKGFKYLKRYGFFATCKKVLKTIRYRIIFRKKDKLCAVLAGFVQLEKYSTVIVFENNFGWNKIMKQRPQQIASNLPDNVLMIYHSHEDEDYTDKTRIKVLKDNLLLVDLGYYRDAVFHTFANVYDKYLMVYSTDYIPYERIQLYEEYRYKVIYEYVDDLNEELSGDTYFDLLARHNSVLKDENVFVVSTATKLKSKIEESSFKKAELITNGVDYEHFKYAKYDVPEDMQEIRNNYLTVLCYYGALANWFDYDLILKVAENKNYAIVLIGQDYDDTLSKSGILDIDNVFFLGRKGYDVLPSYACNADVCIIPFVINEITEATSPVKLFEYMAMEKPIVTTALPECKKYQSVFYSESHEAFVENIERAIQKNSDPEYKELLIKEALDNTWASKAKAMISFVSGCNHKSVASEISGIFEQNQFDRIIVWRSPFGWAVPLFQRPQHIARQFAKKGCLVFYEVNLKTDPVVDIKAAEDNLYLVNFENPIAKNALESMLAAQDRPVYIQIYSTNWSMSMSEVDEYIAKGFNLLYEYIDDISPELSGTEEIPEYVLDKYNFAMGNKRIPVVTTAKQLYDDVVSKRGTENMVLACNGVDYDFFRDLSSPPEFENNFSSIIHNGKINVCYYGALASWFDYDLIKKIDATDKYNVVLIGIKYDESYDNSGIGDLKNVYFIGPKEYHILKYYADKMDVLTIPFVINSITQATSPLKLFEYMALHKPIVTTAMLECKNYKSVMVAENHNEFLEHLDRASKATCDSDYMVLLDREAQENDWSKKAELIIELLKENERGQN